MAPSWTLSSGATTVSGALVRRRISWAAAGPGTKPTPSSAAIADSADSAATPPRRGGLGLGSIMGCFSSPGRTDPLIRRPARGRPVSSIYDNGGRKLHHRGGRRHQLAGTVAGGELSGRGRPHLRPRVAAALPRDRAARVEGGARGRVRRAGR